jgi:Fic family protein
MPQARTRPNPGQSDRAGVFRPVTEGSETYYTFYPKPLPPDPPLDVDIETQRLLDSANQALGRLDGVTLLLPDPDLFLYSYIRKEAVLSSQIEGTQSSLSDLLLFEHDVAPGAPLADVRETSNYIAAMTHGLARIEGGFPLSLRLINEIHERLMEGVRGGRAAPGEFRRTQNWIGGTRPGTARYVPPPHQAVMPAMGALELFLHDDPVATPILIKAALAHAQFESIHPFLDGNGRVGRLLITLLLSAKGAVLSRPLLYLSLYLKEHRDEYYGRLTATRTEGDWEGWLRFFLEGVIEVAGKGTETTQEIVKLVNDDRQKVVALGRAAGSAARLHEFVTRQIVFTIKEAARKLDMSEVTAGKAATHLVELGVVTEMTGKARNRVFIYSKYLELLQEEEPPPLAASTGSG